MTKKRSGFLLFVLFAATTYAYGQEGCSNLLPLQAQIKADNEQYNKLTHKSQASQKRQLKAKIAQELNELNAAFANCGQCGRIAPLQAQIKAGNEQYNKLTHKNQASQRQQLKAKLVAEQNELTQRIAACPPCAAVTALQAQIKADNEQYDKLTHKNQAGQRQQLKAKIIAEQNELNAIEPGCIVPLQ